MMNYSFGLINKQGEILDATNIDENNPDFAMRLFYEYAPHEKYSATDLDSCHVELIAEVDE